MSFPVFILKFVMASVDYNQDEPPPLEDCSEYLLTHQHLAKKSPGTQIIKSGSKCDTTSLAGELNDDCSRFLRIVPSTTQDAEKASNCHTSSVTTGLFKKGFLNDKPSSGAKSKSVNLPFIKAAKNAEKVPRFLKLDLKDNPQEQFKKELKDLMKPTQELVNEVLSNNEIQAGLEDPEIMVAVQDIASNPSAMHKYKNYSKIVNFYNNMGKLMSARIEKQEKEKK